MPIVFGYIFKLGNFSDSLPTVKLMSNFNPFFFFSFSIQIVKQFFTTLYHNFMMLCKVSFKCCRESAEIVILLSILLSCSCLPQVQ